MSIPELKMERRLAAILSADVVGYSRLMGEDEVGTLAALKRHRKELLAPKTAQYNGNTIKLMGDGALVEFASVVEAVTFAVEVQLAMRQRNAGQPEDRQILYRIGINIGDIIIEDDDIFGDGVNVAARLEGLAEPGGICFSRPVHTQIKGKLDLTFEHLGDKELKNIAEPVSVYRVNFDDKATALVTPIVEKATKQAPWRLTIAAAAVVLLVAVGGVIWWQPWASEYSPAEVEKMALPLPKKPSIAVLAFENMSGDPEQEYFSDGISEDIITDLSKASGLFVIARHSSFKYKGRAVNVQQVGRELGVRYVLEGSVRKVGDRVRITAQLIDASSGGHLWAERYDRNLERNLKNIFAVQDEITEKIVTALEVKLSEGEQRRIARQYTDNLEAYDHFLRARGFHGGHSKKDNNLARQLLDRSIELDPSFAAAYAELSWVHHRGWFNRWSEDPEQSYNLSLEFAQKAVALDDTLPAAYARLGWGLTWHNQYQQGIAEGRRAIELDPNYADGYLMLGHVLIYGGGSPEEAIRVSTEGMRLDPHSGYHYLLHIADGYWTMGQNEEALTNLKRAVTLNPKFMPTHLWLAVVYASLGRIEEARAATAEVLRQAPQFSIDSQKRGAPYKDQAMKDRFIEALRKAGVPE